MHCFELLTQNVPSNHTPVFFLYKKITEPNQTQAVQPRSTFLSETTPSRPLEIPARSECTIPVEVGGTIALACLARTCENGLMIGNCVVQPKNGIAPVKVVNNSNKIIKCNTLDLDLQPLSEFDILSFESNASVDRIERVLETIQTDHLNTEECDYLRDAIANYSECFHLKGDSLSFCDAVMHKLPVIPGTAPINVRPYRLPMSQREEIQKQIDKMLKENIIQPSKSAWNAPLLIVPKKSSDGTKKWRVVVDFRKINDVTISDSFPLPNITDILDQLGDSKYFSTLDLASGYHQVLMDPSDREKTAFSTGYNHYEWVRMPMGLKSASHTFQRLMNNVLTGLNGIDCFVYLDDLVIYANSLKDHYKNSQGCSTGFANII